jgi:GTP-binding protein HflX
LRLPREREIVINDTVGFIRDLPADLMAAFRATLEEIEDSDLVVHVVDVSHAGYEAHIQAVHRILTELGYDGIPRLLVFNKVDRVSPEDLPPRLDSNDALPISALKGEGIQELLHRIDENLPYRRGFASIYPVDRPDLPR